MFSRQDREKMQAQELAIQKLVLEITELKATREAYERSLLISDERYDRLLALYSEAQAVFKAVAEQYTDGLARARATISSLEANNTQLSQPFSNRPLHMNEEEEDLTWQLDHGVLNLTEYNEALRAAGISGE